MKVKITHTLDIDPEKWEMNYGVSGADDIRSDVKAHVANTLFEYFGPVGVDVLRDV